MMTKIGANKSVTPKAGPREEEGMDGGDGGRERYRQANMHTEGRRTRLGKQEQPE